MTHDDEARLTWEKREDETSKAFAAFVVYRDLGPGRSYDKAYRAAKGQNKRQASGRWREWAAKFDWLKRAQDYDAHIDLQTRQKNESEHQAELETFRTRQKSLAQATTASCLKLLRLANARIDDLQKSYDDWKKLVIAATDEKEREELMKQCPINLMSIPNWVSSAARVAQVSTDAESQALAVNELLQILKNTSQQ